MRYLYESAGNEGKVGASGLVCPFLPLGGSLIVRFLAPKADSFNLDLMETYA